MGGKKGTYQFFVVSNSNFPAQNPSESRESTQLVGRCFILKGEDAPQEKNDAKKPKQQQE